MSRASRRSRRLICSTSCQIRRKSKVSREVRNMGNKWIWTLLSALAVNSLLGQQPALGQEKRKTYTLPQNMKSDAAGESPSTRIAAKAADIERGPENPMPSAVTEKPVVRGVQLLSSQNSTRVMLD